jgi:chemotaxis methyl-accepting protein methylase
MNTELEEIITVMSEKHFKDISVYDYSFIKQTIETRVACLSLKNTRDYLNQLDNDSSEAGYLYSTLNNVYSEFFRNPLVFSVLEKLVFPRLFRTNTDRSHSEIRVWSAGCSAGQEAYSIAILLEDYRNTTRNSLNLRIFATDKSEIEIAAAKTGIYNSRAVQNTKLNLINQYFTFSGEQFSVKNNIKALIDFSVFDLLKNDYMTPPSSIYGDFDIVICSNLLFYYKPEIQQKILSKLVGSLAFGGFLISDEAECSIIRSVTQLKQFALPSAIFMKV